MAMTRFTNNVLRAKAVKKVSIGGSNTKKFTNKVGRARPPVDNIMPGQSIPGKQRASTPHNGGGQLRMSINKTSQHIKAA